VEWAPSAQSCTMIYLLDDWCTSDVHTCAEGAFGTVDLRKLTNSDGTESFFAVKRLKKQQLDIQVLHTAVV
jgi:hypothetical protein